MVIYLTINLINGKKYIGQDSNNNPNYLGSGVYLNKAIKKYGKENFKKLILEHVNNITKLNEREEFWIKKFNAHNSKEFYNLTEKGRGWPKGKSHGRRKILETPIDQYDFEGKFIKSWESIKEANVYYKISVGGITNTCKGKHKSAGGFIWTYKNNKPMLNNKPKPNHKVAINQYDKNMKLIKEWSSISEAEESLNLWNIKKVLSGKNKTCGGYVWNYKYI